MILYTIGQFKEKFYSIFTENIKSFLIFFLNQLLFTHKKNLKKFSKPKQTHPRNHLNPTHLYQFKSESRREKES